MEDNMERTDTERVQLLDKALAFSYVSNEVGDQYERINCGYFYEDLIDERVEVKNFGK